MTSRERVRKAINHEVPDRVPVDVGAFTNIHVDQYCNICRHLGIEQLYLPPRVNQIFDYHAAPDIPVLNWFGSDFVNLYNPFDMFGHDIHDMHIWKNHSGNDILISSDIQPEKDERGYSVVRNAEGKVVIEMATDGVYFDRPILTSGSDDIEFADLKEFRKTLPALTDENLKSLQSRAKFLYEYTDRSVFGYFSDRALWSPGGLLAAKHNFSDWTELMMTEPEYCHDVLGTYVDWYVEKLEVYLQAVGQYIDAMLMSTADFGSQRAPFFGPHTFREIYMPHYKVMNGYVHEHSNVKTFFHSCGSIAPLFPCLIESGVDIINPIQTAAANMDPAELKQKYGNQIVFWGGGIDTQHVLPHGTPEEVREMVKERMEILSPGGGFVFTTEHCIQSDVPFENLQAMVEAAKEFGQY